MRIYPLAIPTAEAARYHCDLHLRIGVTSIAKILSDAGHVAAPDHVGVKVNDKGEKEYWLDGSRLMPPSSQPSVWSTWAANNSMNGWWLVDFSYQLNKEYKERLGMNDLPDHLRIQGWVVAGLMKKFKKGNKIEDFPISLPPKEIIKIGEVHKMSVVDIYRSFYVAQKGRIRMKWTKREQPFFFDAASNEAPST